jgi:hypothetical protein
MTPEQIRLQALPRYVKAYQDSIQDNRITPADLLETAKEEDQFSTLLKILVPPTGPLRNLMGSLPASAKGAIGRSTHALSNLAGINFSNEIGNIQTTDNPHLERHTKGLNNHQFRLSVDGERLRHLEKDPPLHTLFPRDKKKDWPVITLVANSDLTSPQDFFDSFQAAKSIVPSISRTNDKRMVIVGTYCTEHSFAANMDATVKRYNELCQNPKSMQHVKSASRLQAKLILSLIVKHDEHGASIKAEGEDGISRPIIRSDAAEIMRHVVTYAYSGGHLRNKDAFRVIADRMSNGKYTIEVKRSPHAPEDEPIKTKISSAADAKHILTKARTIGMGGSDPVHIHDSEKDWMPQDVNFLSKGDKLICLNGAAFVNAPNNVTIQNPKGNETPLENKLKGHAQNALVTAVLNEKNTETRLQAMRILDGKSLTR